MTKTIERILIAAVAAAAVVWAAREITIRRLATARDEEQAAAPAASPRTRPAAAPTTSAAVTEEGPAETVKPVPSLVGRSVKVEQAPPDDFLARLNDSKRQDYVKAGLVVAMDTLYGPLFRCYQITPDQMAYLKYLLAERLAVQNDYGVRLIKAAAGEKAGLVRERDAAMAEREALVRAFLGAEAFELYEGYERSLPDRMLLKDLKDELETRNMPFSYEQEDALIRMMYEERMNAPEIRDLLSGRNAGVTAGEIRAGAAGMLRSYDAMIERIKPRCTGQLEAGQYAALTNHLGRLRLTVEAAVTVISNLSDDEIAAAASGALE